MSETTDAPKRANGESPRLRHSHALHAIWLRLALLALVSAIAAWPLPLSLSLQSALISVSGGKAVGLQPGGFVALAAPVLIWLAARFWRGGASEALRPAWAWLFAIAFGVAANTAALALNGGSLVSVFVLSAAALAVEALLLRLLVSPPPLFAAWGVYVLVGALCAAAFDAGDSFSLQTFLLRDVLAVLLLSVLLAARYRGMRIAANNDDKSQGEIADWGARIALTLASSKDR